jgi:4-diphosphocytidyl-2-C-methyl-D-erythritol kinase
MENKLVIKSYAKLNLALAITGASGGGFHSVDMVMQEISLHDTVTLERADGISVDCPGICGPRENTAYTAARLFFEKTGLPAGVSITIYKKIPAQAGLGGGSSNAAAVLTGLRGMFGAQIDDAGLYSIAASVGSDVPFFLSGGGMRARGRGEMLTPLSNSLDLQYLLVKPRGGVGTAEAYKLSDSLPPTPVDIAAVASALAAGDARGYFAHAGNALYPAALELCPQVGQAVADLTASGALFSMMTGSGSCVFGVFNDAGLLCRAGEKLARSYPFVARAQNIFRGPAGQTSGR